MKRYIIGIFAAVIAIGAFAFDSSKTDQSPVTFKYNPGSPEDYSQNRVQDKQYWSAGTQTCPEGNDKACMFQVPFAQTTSGGTQLGASVTITATLGGESGKYRVSGGAYVSNIENKD